MLQVACQASDPGLAQARIVDQSVYAGLGMQAGFPSNRASDGCDKIRSAKSHPAWHYPSAV